VPRETGQIRIKVKPCTLGIRTGPERLTVMDTQTVPLVSSTPQVKAGKQKKPDIAYVHGTLGTRVEPGEYDAYVRVAEHYRDPVYKRWTCILKFDLFDDNLTCMARNIPMWFNLGRADKPKVGRRSNYWREWFRANGNVLPRRVRADRMLSPRVFERRFVRVRVDTNNSTPPYSVVREIVDWKTGGVSTTVEHNVPLKASAHARVEGNHLNLTPTAGGPNKPPAKALYERFICPDCAAQFAEAGDFAKHSAYDCVPCRWVANP